MTDAAIPTEIDREKGRRQVLADAARRAAAEVGALNGPDKDFCELTYILGSMREAEKAHEARS